MFWHQHILKKDLAGVVKIFSEKNPFLYIEIIEQNVFLLALVELHCETSILLVFISVSLPSATNVTTIYIG